MTPPILTVDAVSKRFGAVEANRAVSLEVRRGEIFALLGPNGAGKSTLVRMLMGVTRPDTGRIRYDLGDGDARWPAPSQLGYLPEERGMFTDVPVLRTLVFFAGLRGMRRAEAEREARRWLGRLDLKDREREKVSALSKGNQQKVQFIAAVIHRPAFAVLDEPFSGLDPINQDVFLDLLDELRREGMTILLSAHHMQLVERIADRILLLSRGREVLSGTLDEIRAATSRGQVLRLRLAPGQEASPLLGVPGVASVAHAGGDEHLVNLEPGASLSPVLALAAARLDVRGVHSERESLHDIYVRTIGGESATPASPESAA